MVHIPLLRAGVPYTSLSLNRLTDIRNGAAVAEVSLANPGLIARDLTSMAESRRELETLSTAELLGICRRAAQFFMEEELPVGAHAQSPDDYLQQLAATTGMPMSLGRSNMQKIHFVLAQMETVLAGLTRGLDLAVLDRGWGIEDARNVSFRRETDALGVVLPSNSPGVHSLWLPAIALKTVLVLKPGSQEPWTPYRVAQALLAAGCPPRALGFYPTDYAGASEILMRCGRSMLFGDRSTVAPWTADPRVQIHGPGWSKIVIGADQARNWRQHLELIVDSVSNNCGRSCINASGVWTADRGREIAEAIAERLAAIEAHPLDDPRAQLAAFPSVEAAERLSRYIDSQLATPGATDLTARLRAGGRVARVDGCGFLLPTVVYCEDPKHPLAQAEFLFPFVSVVDAPAGELVERMGPTLVATGLTEDPGLERDLMASPHIERLNLGPIPTCAVSWDQPHEGNLFEHLYRQRALQGARFVSSPEVSASAPSPGGLG